MFPIFREDEVNLTARATLLITVLLLVVLLTSCESLEPPAALPVSESVALTATPEKMQPVAETVEPTVPETVPETPEPAVIELEPEPEALPAEEPVPPAVLEEPETPVESPPAATPEEAPVPQDTIESPAEPTASEAAPARPAHLYILHTNDTRGFVSGPGIGFPRLKTIVDLYRDQVDSLLLVDAGNSIYGNTFSDLDEGESVARLMEAVGYDAMAAGPDDLVYGFDHLLELNGSAGFPILSASIWDPASSTSLPSHALFTFDDFTVGVFGLLSGDAPGTLTPEVTEGLVFHDTIEVASALVEVLSLEADVIIALTNLGTDEAFPVSSLALASAVPGIDLIVDGNTDSPAPAAITAGDTLIVQAGSYGQAVGAVDITIDEGNVTGISAKLYTLADVIREGIVPDEATSDLIVELTASQEALAQQPAARLPETLEGEEESVRTRPSSLAAAVTTAMIDATGSDCALIDAVSFLGSLDAGEVTYSDIHAVLEQDQPCVVIEVTGAQLVEAVEHGLAALPGPAASYCQLGGLTPLYNIFETPGARLYGLRLNGKAINPEGTYRLATSLLIASGDNGYGMFSGSTVLESAGSIDRILSGYLSDLFPVSLPAGNP